MPLILIWNTAIYSHASEIPWRSSSRISFKKCEKVVFREKETQNLPLSLTKNTSVVFVPILWAFRKEVPKLPAFIVVLLNRDTVYTTEATVARLFAQEIHAKIKCMRK